MSNTSQTHAINCHTPPSHPIPCHSSPSHPLPCHNSLSQPIPCHTSPSHSVLCHNSPSHSITCRTSPSHSIPCHNSPSRSTPFHTLGKSKNKEICDSQPWHSSSTTDGAGSESDPGHGFNLYSRRLSARLGEVAGDIAEVAGDLKDNSPTFDKTRRRLSARLCRVTVDMSENTEALLQHTINNTTSAIRRSLSTGNNYFSSAGLADNDLAEGAGGFSNVGNLDRDGGFSKVRNLDGGGRSVNVGNLDADGGSVNVRNLDGDGEPVADERRERADSGGELSPQYDEGEDLESSIAKLRSLLEEKERTESGSFDSGHEDIAEIDIDSPPAAKELHGDESKVPEGASSTAEATPGGFHNLPQENMQKMDLTKDTVPRPTLPEDGKLFMSVVISSAEVQEQNMQQFVLYFIQYEGIFLAPASPPGTFEYIVQTCKVKRRFSEFLNLQNRLENNNKLKMFLKGIKGPSKWLTLPFAKVDKSFVASRRAVLERWLGQLCDIPVINVSQEIREFLAYGSDGSIAYLRKSGSSQRINQFLARTVTGVFNSLKDVLPSFEGDELSENVERPDKETRQGFFAFKSRTEEYQVIATFVPQPRSVGICEEDVMEYHLQQLQEWGDAMEADQSPLLMGPRPPAQPVAQDPPRPPLSTDDLMEDDIPVAALLINLASSLVASSLVPTKTWMSSIAVNRTAKILTGNVIQDAVQGLVSDYCSEAGHVKCIRFLLDFLWNQPQTSLDTREFSQKWEATKTSLCACIGEDCVTTWRTILSNDAATLELILDVVDTVLAHLVVNKEKHFLS